MGVRFRKLSGVVEEVVGDEIKKPEIEVSLTREGFAFPQEDCARSQDLLPT